MVRGRGGAQHRNPSPTPPRSLCSQGSISSPARGEEKRGHADSPAGERGITPKVSNGRQPVRWCSNHTSVAARLSCERRTKTTRNVRSALWHRAATGRARVLTVNRAGQALLREMRVPRTPAPDVFRRWWRWPPKHFQRKCDKRERRAPAVKRGRSDAGLSTHRTRCGQAYNRYGSFCQDVVGATRLNATYPRCPRAGNSII